MCAVFFYATYVVARKALEEIRTLTSEMPAHCSTPVDLSGQLVLIWVEYKSVDDKHGSLYDVHTLKASVSDKT